MKSINSQHGTANSLNLQLPEMPVMLFFSPLTEGLAHRSNRSDNDRKALIIDVLEAALMIVEADDIGSRLPVAQKIPQ